MTAPMEPVASKKPFSAAAGAIGAIFWMLPHLMFLPLAALPFSRIFLFVLALVASGCLFFPLLAGFCRCSMAKLCGERAGFSLLFSCFGKDYARTAFLGVSLWLSAAFSLLCCLLPFFGCFVCYLWQGAPLLLAASSLLGGIGLIGWLFWCTRYLAVPVLLFDRSLNRKNLLSCSKQLTQGAHISFFWLLFRYLIAFCLIVPIPFCLGRMTDRLAQTVHRQSRTHHIYQLEDWSVG